MRLFVHNLTNVDFSFLHPTRGLVGETWQASIELIGELDEQGMVVDFGRVKGLIRSFLDEKIDHRLLVPIASPFLRLQSDHEKLALNWSYIDKTLLCSCPNEAIARINSGAITAESVAHWCIGELMQQFPASVKKVILTFAPEHIEGPYYHYSHGLKKHDGNCQRIAHGHRSRILIWRDGELDHEDMHQWSNRWQDIYIGTKEDQVACQAALNTAFQYRTRQGDFYLEIPSAQCYLIDTDSTIELIALHIAYRLKKENPQHTFKVKAFEGLAKGAIAES